MQGQPTTTYGPLEIWHSMGTVGHLVLVFLLLMSIYSIAVMVDRYLLFGKARTQSLRFIAAVRGMLADGRLESVLEETKRHPKSHLARVYSAAIQDFLGYTSHDDLKPGFEATVARAMDREATLVTQDMKRGLSGLASIGATAPFVGLLGTVVGIMNGFFGMASAGSGGVGAVAGGIAEALVNTAAGLFVALPAVWGFNYFLGRMERITSEMSNASSELVDYFIKNVRGQTWSSAAVRRPASR